jgi:hypothetical protein
MKPEYAIHILVLTTLLLAILGGLLVGVSDCRKSDKLFCQDDSVFIAGYFFLMLMIMCCINIPFVWYECYNTAESTVRLILINWIVVCAIIGGTLVGVSNCALTGQEFCRQDPLFIAGFSFLMLMTFSFIITLCLLMPPIGYLG